MFKITIAVLLAAFTTFSNCNKTQQPGKEAASPGITTVTAAPGTNTVLVSFSGLMIFHQEKGKLSYEVGILGPRVARDHKFSVVRDGLEVKDLPNGPTWTLEITNPSPTAGISPVGVGHSGRRPDDLDGQYDFDWLIDLEGSEFHGHKLTLKPGLLKPIIHLPDGLLYTAYKSVDLKRFKVGSGDSDFGFVPETITLHLELHEAQELVLRDDKGGVGAEVLRLPYKPNQAPYLVSINNVREPLTEASDFRLYYQLFDGVPDASQYDFKANKDPGKLSPFNPLPGHKLMTCCMLLCTEVLLSQRTKPLE